LDIIEKTCASNILTKEISTAAAVKTNKNLHKQHSFPMFFMSLLSKVGKFVIFFIFGKSKVSGAGL
jgi:hypothetical protein